MFAERSPQTPSSIPTRTSKSSSLLPTPTRRPSFSTPGPSPISPAGVSGFRALRSLLPFGPNKHVTPISPPVASSNSNGHRFASFSAVRKSVQRDRNASLSSSDLPVMVIDKASVDEVGVLGFPPVRKSISLHEDPLPSLSAVDLPTVNFPNASPGLSTTVSPSSSSKGESPKTPEHSRDEVSTVRTPSPLPELSTIIEVDTSGISKHLPSISGTPSPSSSLASSLAADETSALDLSTTHLKAQVIDAMKAQESAPTSVWLETSQSAAEADQGDVSFNLSALDPDLAALLSPNRMVSSDTNHTIRAAKSSVDLNDSPPRPSSSGGSRPQHQSSRPRLRPIQRPSTPPDTMAQRSPSISPSSTAASRAQTVRRAPPSPLSASHPPSPLPSSAAIPESPLSSSPPVTSSTPAVRRTQTSAAASASTSRRPLLGRMLKSDSWETTLPSIHSPTSRPSLDSSAYTPSAASRASLDTNRQRSSIDTNRQRSSIDTNRNGTTTNFNSVRERPSDRDNSAAWNLKLRRTRKRSMSVDERQRTSSPGPASPASSRPGSSMSNRPEWLGPRTAKAFKAAGLLGSPDSADGSNSLSPPSSSSRSKFGFGSVRSNPSAGRNDSRLGVASPRPGSSAGSNSGRMRGGSGSGSYFGSAGSTLMESPTMTMSSRDTPRSASTAPTSVSGASWGRDGEELRELKDKHAVETGALLSALSDSQRTTKVLREENSELRERLAQVEAESERMVTLERENQALREFVSELREEAGQLKLQLRLAAPVATSSRLTSPVSSSSRYLAPSTAQAFRLAPRGESPRNRDGNLSEDSNPNQTAFPAPSKLRKRLSSSRMSNSSSIFHAPPSNMSLLLHEDGANSSDFDDKSGASASLLLASPTMVLPRLDASPNRAHRANQSITSVATTSPNASMLGSPRSLLLMPEHEVHLGDMDSLDLGRAGPDEDWSE
ncbi:hypothetical protein B0H12DRAFT_1086792 [Mycena haematopus]|nr:hypothetical protein B0H12DRAFT_1086792 [Mycena haematopus]